MHRNKNRHEDGNVFIFILLGIVMFVALTLTLTRGMRGETAGTMTAQKAALAAADILDYAQRIEHAVDFLRRRGISESDISFEQDSDTDYSAHARPDSSKIFHADGGKATWKKPPAGANDGSDWYFIGTTCIADLGAGATGCDTDSVSNEELLAVLANIDPIVCQDINRRLGITGIPADTGGGASGTKYIGTFADGTEIILAGGPFSTACFSRGGSYYFYTVLLAR